MPRPTALPDRPGPSRQPSQPDPWDEPMRQQQSETAAADPVAARRDKRPAAQSLATELHAAFEAAAIHRLSPADSPGGCPADPAAAAVAAADHALAQALAGLSPAAVSYTHLTLPTKA